MVSPIQEAGRTACRKRQKEAYSEKSAKKFPYERRWDTRSPLLFIEARCPIGWQFRLNAQWLDKGLQFFRNTLE
jgi:hypothetical protein